MLVMQTLFFLSRKLVQLSEIYVPFFFLFFSLAQLLKTQTGPGTPQI